MKPFSPIVLGIAAAFALVLGGAFFALSCNSVQQKIATEWLRSRGVEAHFEKWNSSGFSRFGLENIALNFDDDRALRLKNARISMNVPAAIFGNLKMQLETDDDVKFAFGGNEYLLPLRKCEIASRRENGEFLVASDAFPLAFFDTFSGGKFRFSGTLSGEILCSVQPHCTKFSTHSRPLKIRDFSLTDIRGKTHFRELSLDAEAVSVSHEKSDSSKTEIVFENARFADALTEIANADALQLRFRGNAIDEVSGKIRTSLVALARQPIFTGKIPRNAGTLECDGTWNAGTSAARISAELRDFREIDGESAPPKNVKCRFVQNADELGNDAARLVLEIFGAGHSVVRARFSRLECDFADSAFRFDAAVNAETVYAEDFYALAQNFARTAAETPHAIALPAKAAPAISAKPKPALPKSEKAVSEKKSGNDSDAAQENAASVPETAAVAESVPAPRTPWAAFSGKAKFRIGRFVGFENEIREISGEVGLTEKRVDFSAKTAQFFDGAAGAEFSLEARDRSPFFAGRAQVKIRDAKIFNAVPAIREKDPVPAEGIFSATFCGNATADACGALAGSLETETKIIGRDGHLRIFAGSDRARFVSGLANFGGDLIGALGEIAGGFSSKARQTARSINRLQRDLTDFSFGTFEAELRSRAGEPLRCEKFLLRGEQLQISGTGEIDYFAAENFGDAPLKISARLDARGDAEDALRTLRAIRGEVPRDDAGYAHGPKFEMTGTPNRFSDDFLKAALRAVPGFTEK